MQRGGLFFIFVAVARFSRIQMRATVRTSLVLHQTRSFVMDRQRAGAMVTILYPVASNSVERS